MGKILGFTIGELLMYVRTLSSLSPFVSPPFSLFISVSSSLLFASVVFCAVLCYAVLCCVVLCCAVVWCGVLLCVVVWCVCVVVSCVWS